MISRRALIATTAIIPFAAVAATADDKQASNSSDYCFPTERPESPHTFRFSGVTNNKGVWTGTQQILIENRIPYAVSPIVTEDRNGPVVDPFDQGLGHALFVITDQQWVIEKWLTQNGKKYSVSLLKMKVEAKHWFDGGDIATAPDNVHWGDTRKLPNFMGKLQFNGLIHALV